MKNMRLSLTASLVLVVGLMQPVGVSLFDLPEDLEGSGSDQEGSGSGNDVEIDIKDDSSFSGEVLSVSTPQEGNENLLKQASDMTLGNKHGPPSGIFVFGNRGSFLENKQIRAGTIAGGITGAVLGAALSAILIYKWRKKHEEECILSKKRDSDENY